MHGKGIFTWPDGRRFEGEYDSDKNTDLEHLHSEMDAYMKESGRMENSTDVGFTVRRRYQERGYGRMV